MEKLTNISNDVFFYQGIESDTFMKNYPAETLGGSIAILQCKHR